ncbi:MAG: protease HtpX [Micavibrio sp.]|nr:MAG: protease HtpX [Micavibrio sp.]
MAGAGTGLNTHIWNNNIRSVMLLIAYPFLIMAMVWAVALVVGVSAELGGDGVSFAHNIIIEFWPAIISVVAVWFMVAWLFHTKLVRRLAHSHPVTRQDEPELYNLLENLCISRGMPMPKLEIVETHARNAFASGIDQKSFSVTVTRGLLNSLQKDEVEAVLAHELTHIENRDVRLLIVCIIFTGMIGFAAQLAWSNARYSMFMPRNRNNRSNGGALLFMTTVALILWVGYMATLFMRFALSRRREYMADAGAVEKTKDPEAMMRALLRIAGRERIPGTTDDIAMMCIENSKPFFGMFATHPPIDERIKAISQVTGTPIPEIRGRPVGEERSFKDPQAKKNPWLIRERGMRKRL